MGNAKSRQLMPALVAEDTNPILGRDYGCNGYNIFMGESKSRQGLRSDSITPSRLSQCKASLLDKRDLVYHFKQRGSVRQIRWQLNGLRWYGYKRHIFTFEAGRRCQHTGIFLFKCKQASFLSALLRRQVHWLMTLAPSITDKPTDVHAENGPNSRISSIAVASGSKCCIVPNPPSASRTAESSLQLIDNTGTAVTRDQRRHSSLPVMTSQATHSWIQNHSIPDSAALNDGTGTSCLPILNSFPTGSLNPACGVYLFAVPDPPVAHCYENQHAMIGSYYGENTACS
uniref:Fibroblast growth factor receptor substrate 3 n=1 Tax=Schistocephalus solidus TaxID=70667 RepID=A0A0X3NV16_SCHSO